MEVLGLYDEEMSLFGGDLLGIAPAPVEDRFSEDVLKSSIRGQNVVTVLPGQDVLGLEQSNKNYSGQIDQSWLDTKIDLLDYLADEVSTVIEDAAPSQSLDIKPIEASNDDDGSAALKVLQSVADDTIAMIMSEAESGDVSEQPMETEEENNSSLLLEMLTSDLTECISATDLEPLVEDSAILSPVTPEDVETVLSSGPPSPTAELSLLDSTDSSFVDSSFTSSSEQTPVYLDLAQLLQQVQTTVPQIPESSDDSSLEDLADPTYEPYPAKNMKRLRSKSREHTVKKASTAIAKPSKEAKQLERKLRKKQQNKDAALRYREKKRQEQNLIDEECDQLEQRNLELRDKVGQMTREISYLKNLLAEVYEAKGLVKKSK